MKKIFIMNLGTTSFKFKFYLFSELGEEVLAGGEIESVGAIQSHYEFYFGTDKKQSGSQSIANHAEGFSFSVKKLKESGFLKSFSELDAVGYKAVHGGKLLGTRVVDDELLNEMERVIPLAPAHNPVYLNAMRAIKKKYPQLTQIVRFETSFHSTIPDFRTTYGVPYQWREAWGIRKYGFHGSSHEYIADAMKKRCPTAKRIISCHLGGSSSICAIEDGQSIATTMGATAQSGLFNNNRVGDFEVFCLPMLLEHYGESLEEILKILTTESGLLGLSGVSNDMRLVFDAKDKGDKHAKLAIDTFVDNIVGYIGMYIAYLGGLDALVFTGGIGFYSKRIRQMVCSRFSYMGIELDSEKNSASFAELISTDRSSIKVFRIKTDEESIVAKNVYALLQEKNKV